MLRKLFRIQYTSDLHLEQYRTLPAFPTLLKPCAPYLALAGDIGHPNQLRDLFAWAAPRWERIFYVAGNHEYYEADFETRQKELEELVTPYTNIHFLHGANPSFFCEAENVAVVGATLWSRVSKMSDWRTVADPHLNLQHDRDRDRDVLDAEITAWTNRGAQICAISHHMPSSRLIHPRYAAFTLNECFASHSDGLLRSPVRLWIYGYAHVCSHHVLGTTVCICNAKGYSDKVVAGWRPDVWMEFPTADAQELEAVAKRVCTPLRVERDGEDEDL